MSGHTNQSQRHTFFFFFYSWTFSGFVTKSPDPLWHHHPPPNAHMRPIKSCWSVVYFLVLTALFLLSRPSVSYASSEILGKFHLHLHVSVILPPLNPQTPNMCVWVLIITPSMSLRLCMALANHQQLLTRHQPFTSHHCLSLDFRPVFKNNMLFSACKLYAFSLILVKQSCKCLKIHI